MRWGVLALAFSVLDGHSGYPARAENMKAPELSGEDVPEVVSPVKEVEEERVGTWSEVLQSLKERRIEELAEKFPEVETDTVGQTAGAKMIKEMIEEESGGQCSYWHVFPPQLNCYTSNDETLLVSWQLHSKEETLELNIKYGSWIADEVPKENMSLTNDPDEFKKDAARAVVEIASLMNSNWYETADDETYIGLGDSPNSTMGMMWVTESVDAVAAELIADFGDLVVQDGTNIILEKEQGVSIHYIGTGNWYFPVQYYPVLAKHNEEGEVTSFYRSSAMYDENVIHNVRSHLQ